MKIYIAGKVTSAGSFGQVTQKFGAAQVEIQKKGHQAINPLEVVSTWHDQESREFRFLDTPWSQCMRLCIAALMQADAILLLPCWISSPGADLEQYIARIIGMPVYTKMSDIK